MNERQKKFVDYFIQTGNASKAARRAGYSKKNANVIGAQNLTKLNKMISERLKELETQRTADTQEVLEHLTSVLRGEEKETIVTPSGKKFTVPIREADRLRAAENLLRVFGAFRDKTQIEVDGAQLFINTLKKIWNEESKQK